MTGWLPRDQERGPGLLALPHSSTWIKSASPAEDEHSYRFYMNHHLFSRVNIDLANTHIPDGMATDLRAEAAHYEHLIREAGGIDVQLLGIGEAGHIGFNEPLSALMSRTRDKALTPLTRQQNAAMFGGDPDKVPKRAMMMGVGTILDARELLLLATGGAKATILAKAVERPITAMISASALQLHPNCKVIIDEEAARRTQRTGILRLDLSKRARVAGIPSLEQMPFGICSIPARVGVGDACRDFCLVSSLSGMKVPNRQAFRHFLLFIRDPKCPIPFGSGIAFGACDDFA